MEDNKQITNSDIHCSFCGKSGADVLKLISGNEAMICNECVGYCNEILIEEDIDILPKGSPMAKKNKFFVGLKPDL